VIKQVLKPQALLLQKKIHSNESIFTLSKNKLKNLDFFWYGFALYTISAVFAATDDLYIGAAMCQGLQIVGLGLIFIGAANLMKNKFDNKYLQIVFTIYTIFSFTIIGRGVQTDFKAIKGMLFDPTFGVFAYLTPLVLLLPRSIVAYKKIFNTLFIFGVCFFGCIILTYDIVHDPNWYSIQSLLFIENFTSALSLPVGFILLTYLYHENKKNIFALIVMFTSLFFLIYRARRGSMFMCGTTLAAAGVIYLIYTKKKALIIGVAVIFAIFYFLFVTNIKLPGMFTFLQSRSDEDTRTPVEQYMTASMTSRDWIIGKGMNGKYYCPIVLDVNDPSGSRTVIETGYLQIILKGGILSLSLLLLILIPAVYFGFFKSKNILSKAAAMFILLWIIYLKPVVGVAFSMHYILVWISVGICYSKKINNLSDGEIKGYLR
jgi:hypothetical protein